MKKLLLSNAVLVAVVFCGCEQSPEVKRNIERNKSFQSTIETGVPLYRIAVIDSCEYLVTQYYNANAALAHKGNCKFCRERSKK